MESESATTIHGWQMLTTAEVAALDPDVREALAFFARRDLTREEFENPPYQTVRVDSAGTTNGVLRS
jgi:hypothetical protein